VDCGSGTLGALARFGLGWEDLSFLFLTHFHTDHTGDLAPLLFALKHAVDPPRSRPLAILGPPGLHGHLDALASAHGSHLHDPGFPLEVVEMTEEAPLAPEGMDLQVLSRRTRHTESSLAFRFKTPKGEVGFTGDTGPDPSLGHFLAGVDLLVAECSHPDGMGMDIHLTPTGLAELATLASPELLVTVHVYPPLDPARVPDLLRERGYTGRSLAGFDGLEIRVGAGAVEVLDGSL
jgi:ribonuclease BN (tRNA processing enzyme)